MWVGDQGCHWFVEVDDVGAVVHWEEFVVVLYVGVVWGQILFGDRVV